MKVLSFNDYDARASQTAIYPELSVASRRLGASLYPALGLAGEVGEVMEQLKKAIRDGHGMLTGERKAKLKKELGDVLWYLSAVSRELGFTLEEIAQTNIEKLSTRSEAGTLHGEGSDR